MFHAAQCDSDSDQPVVDGPVGPYVACGPVGSYGMLAPCNSDSDPDQPVVDGPVGPYVTRGPVGSYGTLSPCDSDTTGHVMLVRTLPRSPQGDGERMDRHGRWSGSDVVETPTAVDVVDLRARSIVTDVSSNGVDQGDDWDSGYQREIIDGVTVYYGGDLCDSDDSEESDWEDQVDVARREYVEDYKFHLDLDQLWRCPVSWCTVWKGNPQDCMDHVRGGGAHDVPWIMKTTNMEQFVPP